MSLDPALAVWLIWLGACALLALFLPIWWNRKHKIHEHTAQHTVLRNALTDWLQQQRIVQAIHESGTYQGKHLQYAFESLPWMTEGQLRKTAATILKDRMVRRVIAAYMEKEHGTDRATVLKALNEWGMA